MWNSETRVTSHRTWTDNGRMAWLAELKYHAGAWPAPFPQPPRPEHDRSALCRPRAYLLLSYIYIYLHYNIYIYIYIRKYISTSISVYTYVCICVQVPDHAGGVYVVNLLRETVTRESRLDTQCAGGPPKILKRKRKKIPTEVCTATVIPVVVNF